MTHRKSPFGMPFIFGMLQTSMDLYPNYPFYGYINGDILVENTISSVLQQVHKDIQSGKLGEKVSLHRYILNIFYAVYHLRYLSRVNQRSIHRMNVQ